MIVNTHEVVAKSKSVRYKRSSIIGEIHHIHSRREIIIEKKISGKKSSEKRSPEKRSLKKPSLVNKCQGNLSREVKKLEIFLSIDPIQ